MAQEQELEVVYELNNIHYKIIGNEELHQQLQSDPTFFMEYLTENGASFELNDDINMEHQTPDSDDYKIISNSEEKEMEIIGESKINSLVMNDNNSIQILDDNRDEGIEVMDEAITTTTDQEEPVHELSIPEQISDGDLWNRDTILLLLSCVHNRKRMLNDPKLKDFKVWQKIKVEFIHRSGREDVTQEQLCSKYNELKQTYDDIKHSLDDSSMDSEKVKWQYFKILEDINENYGYSNFTALFPKNKFVWNKEIIMTLLKCVNKCLNVFKNPKNESSLVWKKIKKEFLKSGGASELDPDQLSIKFNELRDTYQSVQEKIENGLVKVGDIKWDYYDAVREIMECEISDEDLIELDETDFNDTINGNYESLFMEYMDGEENNIEENVIDDNVYEITEDDAHHEGVVVKKVIVKNVHIKFNYDSPRWSRETVLLLLDGIRKRKHLLNGEGENNEILWREVKEEFEKNGYVSFQEQHLNKKFDILKKSYEVYINSQKTIGQTNVKWEYFDIMKDILSNKNDSAMLDPNFASLTNDAVIESALENGCVVNLSKGNVSVPSNEKERFEAIRNLQEAIEKSNQIQDERNALLRELVSKYSEPS